MNDLVSIIMPSYNTGCYLSESVCSVLDQTYKNWELIVVDDCSSDETDAVIAGFTDPRIRYLKNETNVGAAQSRNRALREAKGRWIAFLDSDDLWDPEKLALQIDFMERGGYSFSYTNYREIGEDSRPLGRCVTGPKRITRRGMYSYCWPGCLTVMYDARAVGLIQIADIRKNNDYAIWLKVSEKADCYLLDRELAAYRRRDGSISSHSYVALIRWHYRLFREAVGQNFLHSIFCTARNLLCGVYKKLFYVRRKEVT